MSPRSAKLFIRHPMAKLNHLKENSSQSDHPPQPSHFLAKQTKFWYILGSPKPPIGNQVKHLLILPISIIPLSSPVIGQSSLLVYGQFTSSQNVELILGIVKSIRIITEMGKLSISPTANTYWPVLVLL